MYDHIFLILEEQQLDSSTKSSFNYPHMEKNRQKGSWEQVILKQYKCLLIFNSATTLWINSQLNIACFGGSHWGVSGQNTRKCHFSVSTQNMERVSQKWSFCSSLWFFYFTLLPLKGFLISAIAWLTVYWLSLIILLGICSWFGFIVWIGLDFYSGLYSFHLWKPPWAFGVKERWGLKIYF